MSPSESDIEFAGGFLGWVSFLGGDRGFSPTSARDGTWVWVGEIFWSLGFNVNTRCWVWGPVWGSPWGKGERGFLWGPRRC